MRDGWVSTTLGAVALLNPTEPALSNTDHFAPMDAVHVGKRWLQYTEERRERNGARARAGDVLFARITPCLENGKVAQVQPEIKRCGGSTEFIVIRGTDICLSDFLYFWCTHKLNRDKAAEMMIGTTGRQRVSWQNLGSLTLHLPPVAEQKKIVDLISSVDSYIRALEKHLESVNAFRKALQQEVLTAGGDDWIETTIGDISNFISIRKTPDQLSTDSIYVGLEHLEPNITSINNFDSTSKVSSNVTPFDIGDVLFGRLRPYLHKVALAEMKGFCSPEILVLRANSRVLPQMLLLYCDADSTIKACVEKSAGTRMPRTSSRDLASIKVLLPPIPHQEHLADLFGTFDANIARLNQSLEKTMMIRAGLLSDLLSGVHEIPTSYDKVMDVSQ